MAARSYRFRMRWGSVQPVGHVAVEIEVRATAAIRPAHVRDRDEERRRQSIERADLAGEESRLSAEAHRADAGLIRFLDDAPFEIRKDRIGIRVVEHPQELFFRLA